MGFCYICGAECWNSEFCSKACEKEYAKQVKDDYGEVDDDD